MLAVHVLYEHSQDLRPHGCSYIRLLLPLTHPSNQEAFQLTYGTSFVRADVIIVERTWRPDISLAIAEDLVKQVRAARACFIYSIDDNILDLEVDTPVQEQPDRQKLMVVRYFAREADAIIVSNAYLKSRFRRFNDHIYSIENALDERLFENFSFNTHSLATNDKKIIGFMGTHTHDNDLKLVLQPLRAILRKHKGSVELQLIGGVADPMLIQAFDDVSVRVLSTEGNVEYPAFMRWMSSAVRWDLAIAPLENNAFTRCKSDIKFLDYSAMGVAGIYSQVPAYENTVRHMETGYLANNDTESWREALELLLHDGLLRSRLATNAYLYVSSQRMLKQTAGKWQSAIMSIVDSYIVQQQK